MIFLKNGLRNPV
jgi:hypothetical protein